MYVNKYYKTKFCEPIFYIFSKNSWNQSNISFCWEIVPNRPIFAIVFSWKWILNFLWFFSSKYWIWPINLTSLWLLVTWKLEFCLIKLILSPANYMETPILCWNLAKNCLLSPSFASNLIWHPVESWLMFALEFALLICLNLCQQIVDLKLSKYFFFSQCCQNQTLILIFFCQVFVWEN